VYLGDGVLVASVPVTNEILWTTFYRSIMLGHLDILLCNNFPLENYDIKLKLKKKLKLHGLSPRANYTDRATAACRRSDCQLLWIEGAMWSA
jgi:hypothetical protein